MSVLIASLLAILTMSVTGFLFVTYLWRQSSVVSRLIIAFPVGYGLWGLLWISSGVLLSQFKIDPHHISNSISLGCYLAATVFLAFKVLQYKLISGQKDWLAVGLTNLILLVAAVFFYTRAHLLLTPDSYFFLNWAQNIDSSLRQGYPLINLANAHLSTLISVDYYLYIVHPLISLSLTLFMVYQIICPNSFNPEQRLSLIEILIAVFLLTIFSMNAMFFMQAFYVNHHVFMALCTLLFSIILLERKSIDLLEILFLGTITLLMTLSRMEGFLFVLLALACCVFLLESHAQKRLLIGVVIIFNFPYLLYLIVNFWDDGFITGQQYTIMMFCAFVMFFAVQPRLLDLSASFINEKMIGPILFGLLSIILLMLIIINPSHMLYNLNVFARNLIGFTWEGATLIILAMVPWIWVFRLERRSLYVRHDTLLWFFASALLLTLVLSYFRSPLGIGWVDSANRMVFHFLPLAYVWMGREIVRLVQSERLKAEG